MRIGIRPWSDHSPDPKNFYQPVLVQMTEPVGRCIIGNSRQISLDPPQVVIDIIFFDAEDYGAPENHHTYVADSWCLGSQYWARNLHAKPYNRNMGSCWIWWE